LSLRVFITGASSGIGEALAVYYAAQGAILGLAGRRADVLAALNERLGGDHACYALDVVDASALQAAAGDFIRRFGVPDIVIASAGVSSGTLSECAEDLAVFRRVMDINVYGMAATFSAFIPAMLSADEKTRRQQRLVGFASVAGIRGLPGAEAYSASKAAAIAYLESLRLEMRPHGIRVVTIAPGYIATPMTDINQYYMPFLMPVAQAARRFAAAIGRGCSYVVIPWQMGLVAKLLRLLPNWLYDRLLIAAPRKSRGLVK
jgi:NAD(P)-dependent dehydrogenase (short-subunit alcohol dehydrogenase family)